jgi:alpha-tubulin suppressor-like RCC1 family protein
VLTARGELHTCGAGASNVLGHGSTASEHSLRRVAGSPGSSFASFPLVDVACGSFHTLAVTVAGEVYSWGWGGQRMYHLGGLGLGSYADAPLPTRVEGFGTGAPGLAKIVQVLSVDRDGRR